MSETPQRIRLRSGGRTLVLSYADGDIELSAEYLRVHSPSAEVQGHGGGEGLLVGGKRDVGITAIEPVGRYAVRLRFSDGHDSGLFSWSVFEDLSRRHEQRWARYLERLAENGMSRDPETNVMPLNALTGRR